MKLKGLKELKRLKFLIRVNKTPLLARRGGSRPMRQSRRESGDGVVEIKKDLPPRPACRQAGQEGSFV